MKKLVNVLLSITVLLAFAACKLGTGAYDVEEPKTPAGQSGSSGNSNSGNGGGSSGKPPKERHNGGFEGTPTQKQGEVVKESWMDEDGNIKIGGTAIPKTSEVVVVPAGTCAKVEMEDDSSWSNFATEDTPDYFKGLFPKERKVKLDSYVMSQYVVTRQLYAKVMNETVEEDYLLRPRGTVTWYRACAFCNELTKKTMGTNECVYYSDSSLKNVYTPANASAQKTVYIAYNKTAHKWTKKGYRLPTETEWEFAARGGDPNSEVWDYAYAGVDASSKLQDLSQKSNGKYDSNGKLEIDSKLDSYALYGSSTGYKNMLDVGSKKPNTLNLYDMCGNIFELCYDWDDYYKKLTFEEIDKSYKNGDFAENPLGVDYSETNKFHPTRGGCCSSPAYICSIAYRYGGTTSASGYNGSEDGTWNVGFRVCRSVK